MFPFTNGYTEELVNFSSCSSTLVLPFSPKYVRQDELKRILQQQEHSSLRKNTRGTLTFAMVILDLKTNTENAQVSHQKRGTETEGHELVPENVWSLKPPSFIELSFPEAWTRHSHDGNSQSKYLLRRWGKEKGEKAPTV